MTESIVLAQTALTRLAPSQLFLIRLPVQGPYR